MERPRQSCLQHVIAASRKVGSKQKNEKKKTLKNQAGFYGLIKGQITFLFMEYSLHWAYPYMTLLMSKFKTHKKTTKKMPFFNFKPIVPN